MLAALPVNCTATCLWWWRHRDDGQSSLLVTPLLLWSPASSLQYSVHNAGWDNGLGEGRGLREYISTYCSVNVLLAGVNVARCTKIKNPFVILIVHFASKTYNIDYFWPFCKLHRCILNKNPKSAVIAWCRLQCVIYITKK